MSAAPARLPPRLASAALAAAEQLTAIAHAEGIEWADGQGAARPPLRTLLATIRQRCLAVEREPQPWLADEQITPAIGKIAVKVINHFGDEVLKVQEVV